jgi:hypothetical protein
MIESIIKDLVENPTEETKSAYENYVNKKEYDLLLEAEKFERKTKEYFNKRTEAFDYRPQSAAKLISVWIKKYKNLNDCPVSYADTLNIPFRKIKKP